MLKLRVISALIVAPLVIAAVFFLSLPMQALVFGVFAALAAVEWARLANLAHPLAAAAFVSVFALLAYGIWLVPNLWFTVLAAACALWIVAAGVVLAYPRSAVGLSKPVLVAGGWLLLVGAWLSLVVILAAPAGPWLLVWLFLLVWGADIGAYFAGRRFGARKLAPEVSPGKTWEGAAGGLALALLAGAAWVAFVPGLEAWRARPVAAGVVMAALVAVSVFGDLFESVLKRRAGVKDSGTLFPGHGGVLDRIDSLIAALPFLAAVVASR